VEQLLSHTADWDELYATLVQPEMDRQETPPESSPDGCPTTPTGEAAGGAAPSAPAAAVAEADEPDGSALSWNTAAPADDDDDEFG
jgi:hypothetical protein